MNRKEIIRLVKNNFRNTYLEKFDICGNAIAILITGSYSRRNFDNFSDIDISIVIKDKSKFNLQGKYKSNDLIFDFRTELESKICKIWKDDSLPYAYFNAYIILDKKNKIRKAINNRFLEFKKNLPNRIATELVELSVLYCFENNWRNLKSVPTHLNKALMRNRLDSAAYIQNIILERIITLFYLLNGLPSPDSKNRLSNLKKNVPSNIYNLILKCLCLNDLSKESLSHRYSLLSKIVSYLKKRVDQELPKNLNLKEIYFLNR